MTPDSIASRATESARTSRADTDDGLALLRAHIARVARSTGKYAIAFLVIAHVLASARLGLRAFGYLTSPASVASFAIGALLVLCASITERVPLRRRPLEALDAALTFLACVGFAVALLTQPLSEHPELSLLITTTIVLMGRAAIVPSSRRRTAIVGTVVVVPLVVATYVAYASRGSEELAWAAASTTAEWGAIAVAASSFTSRRLYAMQRRVDAAERFGQYTLEQALEVPGGVSGLEAKGNLLFCGAIKAPVVRAVKRPARK